MLVLQSSTGQWGLHFAKTRVAVHWWWVTAHLYGQQTFIYLIAGTQACCEPVLQSGTGQWGLHFAKTSAAVHCWWVTAHSYGQRIFIGVIAVTQACREPVYFVPEWTSVCLCLSGVFAQASTNILRAS